MYNKEHNWVKEDCDPYENQNIMEDLAAYTTIEDLCLYRS